MSLTLIDTKESSERKDAKRQSQGERNEAYNVNRVEVVETKGVMRGSRATTLKTTVVESQNSIFDQLERINTDTRISGEVIK